ncbi:MAG: hypothetical protein OXJ52_03760 [Oligoflexia bacterium]|nr:hypothetical protein [Oligoflexia bacterium]
MKTLLILVLFSSFISYSKESFSFFIPYKKGPFFWKAEKEGRTIYILGTIHQVVGLKDLQCHQVISDSLNQSVLVWTEKLQKEKELTDIAAHSLMKDLSGYSFKSLNEETQNFFKTKTNQEQSQIVKQLSYFGLFYLTKYYVPIKA